MKKLTVTDFSHVRDAIPFEGKTRLWDRGNIEIYIDFTEDGDRDNCLKKHIDSINTQLDWVELNKQKIQDILVENNYLSLAENWAASADEAEDEEQECYVMEDGQKVFLPIKEVDFRNSLYLSSVSITFEDNPEKPEMYLYLFCSPDYFSYHNIELLIDEDKNIEVLGLIG